jgi:5-methylcytosine-specific restriction enzyme B
MNTADRSIALLDTALRRRFEFVEMMPNYELLPEDVNGLNIQQLVKVLNNRIEYLYDRDHILGHALFLGQPTDTESFYLDVMKIKIIPLLQEYFYDNWEQIELVLGGSGNNGNLNFFLWKEEIDSTHLFGKRVDGYGKTRYVINPNPSMEAIVNVYKKLQADVDGE